MRCRSHCTQTPLTKESVMLFRSSRDWLAPRRKLIQTQATPRPSACRLSLETLEDRWTPAAMLSIGDMAILEGNTGAQNVQVTVNLTEPHGNSVTVNYNTVDGSAAAGSDYTAASGTLTFTKNVMSKSILIPIRGDRTAESDEYFTVRLSNAKGAKIADDTAFVTITDNEPRISIGDVSQSEGDDGTTLFQFSLSLSSSYDMPVTVHYGTRNGSAVAPGDYAADAGTKTFGANTSTPQLITIAVNGDHVPEPDKTFYVDVTTTDSYASVSRGTGVGTIQDDEEPIYISIDDASVVEGDAGTTSLQLAVHVTNTDDLPVTVTWATRNGSASSPDDYEGNGGTLTFGPNDPSPQLITIQVLGDVVPELDKYFFVDVATPNNYATITRGTAVGTILDDEPRIVVSDTYNYGESTMTFTVSVLNLKLGDDPVTVDFETVNGTAYADVHYVGAVGTLTFYDGTPQTI